MGVRDIRDRIRPSNKCIIIEFQKERMEADAIMTQNFSNKFKSFILRFMKHS